MARWSRSGSRSRAGTVKTLGALAAMALLAPGVPAAADAHGRSTSDLDRQVARSRAQEAGTAAEVGRLEARLAAAAVRSERLATTLGQAVEAYNGAQVRLARARAAAAAAQRDVAVAREAVELSRVALGRFAAQAYRSGGDLGTLSAVLVADGPRDLISRASALQTVAASRARVLARFRAGQAYAHTLQRRADRLVAKRRAAAHGVARARSTAEQRLEAHTAAVTELAAERDVLVRRLAVARNTTVRLERARQDALDRARAAAAAREAEARARERARLAELQARRAEEQRAAEAARQAAEEAERQAEVARKTVQPDQQAAEPDPPTEPPRESAPVPDNATTQAPGGASSGTVTGADAAVAYARAQVGKPYRWAGAGPEAFDCSGLTMRAWEQGGVSLPHYSVAQYERAQKVALTDVRPGDLVFFASNPEDYRTIYHVGLYLGGGQMVEAPYTGENLRVSSIWRGSLLGAARP